MRPPTQRKSSVSFKNLPTGLGKRANIRSWRTGSLWTITWAGRIMTRRSNTATRFLSWTKTIFKTRSTWCALLVKFAQAFPDSAYANQAMGIAATAYQQAQNTPKMLEVANGLLTKNPNDVGMLLLLSDYYGEKGEQLDKAESYAKKALTTLE